MGSQNNAWAPELTRNFLVDVVNTLLIFRHLFVTFLIDNIVLLELFVVAILPKISEDNLLKLCENSFVL